MRSTEAAREMPSISRHWQSLQPEAGESVQWQNVNVYYTFCGRTLEMAVTKLTESEPS